MEIKLCVGVCVGGGHRAGIMGQEEDILRKVGSRVMGSITNLSLSHKPVPK